MGFMISESREAADLEQKTHVLQNMRLLLKLAFQP